MNWRFLGICLGMLLIIVSGAFSVYTIRQEVPANLNGAPLLAVGEEKKSLKDVIFETQKFVVMLETDKGEQGSGFVYNNEGDIITNAHVVSGVSQVRVKTSDARELMGEVIGISTEIDIAVVRVQELAGNGYLSSVRYEKANVGDEVISVGSPLGFQNTVTTGTISGIGRSLIIEPYTYNDLYQISTPIAPGNSGGPLIDLTSGSVLGINSAGLENSSIGFSIPIANVLPLVEGWSKEPMTMLPGISLSDEDTIESTETRLDQMATYLVTHFYDSINTSDYVYAYTLLGTTWQENTSYVKFREAYLNKRNFTIDDIHITMTAEEATVTVVVSANEKVDGEYILTKYQVVYQVGYENDQLKLLSSKSKVIK